MKLSKNATALLEEVKIIHDKNVKIRLPATAVKEVCMSNALHSGVAAAALTILARLADTTPMDFSDRAMVERLVDIEMKADPSDFEACTILLNEVVQILNKYHK